MKVEREIAGLDVFKPFVLKISVESKEEAQALYAIFNRLENCDLLKNRSAIRSAIGAEFEVNAGHIANGVTYDMYFGK